MNGIPDATRPIGIEIEIQTVAGCTKGINDNKGAIQRAAATIGHLYDGGS